MSRAAIVSALLVVVTLLLYAPVRHYGYVDYDDYMYVLENRSVKAGLTLPGMKWAFTTLTGSNWHPLTWISYMFDCEWFGVNPGPQHVVNVLFHAANAVLLFVLLRRVTSTLWPPAFVAAIFAWHPLHVESVAWISERKDVLSTFFALLCLIAYSNFVSKVRRQHEVQSPKSKTAERKKNEAEADSFNKTLAFGPWTLDYFWALALFALGLMAKPMLVTLPFLLLLLDVWPLRRAALQPFRIAEWSRLALEKWPFFALSAASSWVTYVAQDRGSSVAPLALCPLNLRMSNAAISYVAYLWKTLWPTRLAVFYPIYREQSWWSAAVAAAALACVTAWVWAGRGRRPWLVTGWFWFLGALVPVIGLVQVGTQAMADRYSYLPMIGILICAAYSVPATAGLFRTSLCMASVAASVACLAVSTRQLTYWRDSESLFRHALEVTVNNHVAEASLGTTLQRRGELVQAEAHFNRALQLDPTDVMANINLGIILLGRGEAGPAISHLEKALDAEPSNVNALQNMGIVLSQHGHVTEAIPCFEKVLTVDPENVKAQNNLGLALLTQDKMDAAIEHLRKAVEIQPDYAEGHYNLGKALARQHHPEPAMAEFRRSAELKPDYVPAHYALATLLMRSGRIEEAIVEYETALKHDPNNGEAGNDLAWILATYPLASVRNGPRAIELAEHVDRVAGSTNTIVASTLAAAYAEAGRFSNAVTAATRALDLATAGGETGKIASLRERLDRYRSGSAFIDTTLTNGIDIPR